MNTVDGRKIDALIRKGYKVVVKNVFGKTFSERYTVYQSGGFHNLRIAIVNDSGEVVVERG
jgi:hypothetical protein